MFTCIHIHYIYYHWIIIKVIKYKCTLLSFAIETEKLCNNLMNCQIYFWLVHIKDIKTSKVYYNNNKISKINYIKNNKTN